LPSLFRPSAAPAPRGAEPIVRIAPGVFLPPGPANFPYRVTASESDVLGAFLRYRALFLEELKSVSGRTHAHKVLARLRGKADGAFAAAIRLPRRRGNGGYAVLIREATAADHQLSINGPLSVPPQDEQSQHEQRRRTS